MNNAVFAYTGNSVAIEAGLRGGNDVFKYTLGGNVSAGTRSLNANLGVGHDAFTLDATNRNFVNGSYLDVDVVGSAGNDTANITVGQVLSSLVAIRANLGADSDTSKLAFGNIDNGSSVDIDALLGNGTNTMTLDLNGVGKFDQADMSVTILGGINTDKVAVNLHDDVGDGITSSFLGINVGLGDGNDSFTAGLDYDGGSFRVDNFSVASIAVRGGTGSDVLVARGVGTTGNIHIDQGGLLDINFKGESGNDTLSMNFGKPDALFLEGRLRINLDGGSENDVITTLFSNTSTTNGKYDVTVLGGAGNDQVTFALNNNGGTPTFGPLGKVVLNGGGGVDTLMNANAAVSLATFFETIL
ncbi:MAG: hypothetical protein C0467_28550 [Planctomycetaceae bacterium]|nr:hypothetical protein [Planctomycetaceae bacterium]